MDKKKIHVFSVSNVSIVFKFMFIFRLCQRYDIIQKLLWVTMSHLPIDRVEVPVGLIAQLSYYQESMIMNLNHRQNNSIFLL